ncbi:MAG: DUF885 domain-containing protein [Erysipelotrichaceae bacterium]|nr:DUF885 domain-containing protein [Erysipelotrichaceae bacterium]
MRKRWHYLLLALFLAIGIGGCQEQANVGNNEEMQKQFDEFIETDFVDTMESDYLTMHIYLEHPENYGVDSSKTTVQIGEKFDENAMEEDLSELQELRDSFDQFDRKALREDQLDTYDCFAFMLELAEMGSVDHLNYMGSSFNTMTGDHTQIPTLLADLTLRNEQDVKDLIKLVEDVKPYLESDLAYTKKQEEVGTLMIGIDEVVERCQEIVDTGMEGSTLTSMKQHVDELELAQDTKDMYKQQLDDAYRTSFLPAYESVIRELKALDPKKNHTSGLAHMENGKAFYELLFRDATGSEKSIKQVKQELEDTVDQAYEDMLAAITTNPEALNSYFDGSLSTGYSDYATMLVDLEQFFQQDFPSVSKLEYNIQPLPADLATGGIAAYFNIPAIDGTTKKQIRVNDTNKDDIGSIDTFTTVAHEGIPGHMYQIQYTYDNINSPWRMTCTNFSGYTEGYATYVELHSLNYLHVDESVKKVHKAMSVYENALIALIDIGIHYDGWDLEELIDFCDENNLNAEAAEAIYDQIVFNPSAFLSYYVGYQEIMLLKEDAQAELGDRFNEKEFNTALLKSGAAPFSVVERNIGAYVANAK